MNQETEAHGAPPDGEARTGASPRTYIWNPWHRRTWTWHSALTIDECEARLRQLEADGIQGWHETIISGASGAPVLRREVSISGARRAWLITAVWPGFQDSKDTMRLAIVLSCGAGGTTRVTIQEQVRAERLSKAMALLLGATARLYNIRWPRRIVRFLVIAMAILCAGGYVSGAASMGRDVAAVRALLRQTLHIRGGETSKQPLPASQSG